MKKVLLVTLLIVNIFTIYAQQVKNRAFLDPVISSGAICTDGQCKKFIATVTGGTPPYSFYWPTTSEAIPSITPCNLHPGDRFIVQVYDAMGLSASDTVTITMGTQPALVTESTDSHGCAIYCTELSASGADSVEWIVPGKAPIYGINTSLCVEKTTTVMAVGTSLDGCKDTAYIPLEVYPIPEIHISGRTNICKGDTVTLTAVSPVAVQFIWGSHGVPLVIGSSITISPDTTIVKHVIARSAYGCVQTDSIKITVTTCTGVDDGVTKLQDVTIYPNPFETIATISFANEQKNATVKLMDVLGKEVRNISFSGKQLQMDKGDLKSGVYFIHISSKDEEYQSYKLILQ